MSHGMLPPEARTCENPTEQLNSEVSIFSEVYEAQRTTWRFPLNKVHLRFTTSVRLDPAHFTGEATHWKFRLKLKSGVIGKISLVRQTALVLV